MKITVAGAGIGGLSASIALRQRGHVVTVAESAPDITEVGAGLQISPNGMAVLRALGLGDAFEDVSLKAEAVQLIDGPTGRGVLTLDLKRHAPDLDWRLVHRARLIDVLKTAAETTGVQIDLSRQIDPPDNHDALSGDDLLIGADGVHSAMRAKINGTKPAIFSNQVAWRAIIEDDAPAQVEVHMGPRRHLVSYPLPGGLRNIVAVEERELWSDESWRQQDDPENLRLAFQSFAPRVRHWLDKVETVHLWGLFLHPVASRWLAGQQVLLGDAAHPTLPFLAQGANMALEDSWTLASCLDDPQTALDTYETARRARSRRIVDAATRNAKNYHLSFPPLRFAAHTLLRVGSTLAPRAALQRFDWLYRHDVTA